MKGGEILVLGIIAIYFLFLFIFIVTLAWKTLSAPSPAPAPAKAKAKAKAEDEDEDEDEDDDDASTPTKDDDDASTPTKDDDKTPPRVVLSATETSTKDNAGRCGPNHGDKKCSGKQCCSKSGWCGGEKGKNSNWCVNVNKGWWSGKYDGEAETPARVISDSGGYEIHKDKFLPTAKDTDIEWLTGKVRPAPARKVTKVRFCKKRCDELDLCKGFTYKHAILPSQRRCWLKTKKVQMATLTDSDKYDTYMKKK